MCVLHENSTNEYLHACLPEFDYIILHCYYTGRNTYACPSIPWTKYWVLISFACIAEFHTPSEMAAKVSSSPFGKLVKLPLMTTLKCFHNGNIYTVFLSNCWMFWQSFIISLFLQITIQTMLLLVLFSLPFWPFLSQFHLELVMQTSETKPLIYKRIWKRLNTGGTS